MTEEEKITELASHFAKMGAKNPEAWARSEIVEKIPQYARFVFLSQAWKNVVSEEDNHWIGSSINMSKKKPNDPGSGIGPALERILACGVAEKDLTEVVRTMQWEVLFGLMYQLDDSSVVDYPDGDVREVDWILVEVDENGKGKNAIGGLHESVLETDPTGREMRPKES